MLGTYIRNWKSAIELTLKVKCTFGFDGKTCAQSLEKSLKMKPWILKECNWLDILKQ